MQTLPLALELFLVPEKLNPILIPLRIQAGVFEPDLGTAEGAVCASTCNLQRAQPFRSLGNLKGGSPTPRSVLLCYFRTGK